MSSSFSFNIKNDDIEDDASDGAEPVSTVDVCENSKVPGAEPKLHTLGDMLSALPSKISYCSIQIPSKDSSVISLPRRELFDIRAQLMAEDQDYGQSPTIGLSTDDITPNIYEGGFKTWECSVDLASFLAGIFTNHESPNDFDYHIVEAGAGTALPTLMLFYLLLKSSSPWGGAVQLTFADYNQSVLELATIPNLLLTWHFARSWVAPPPVGDLEITQDLLSRFLSDLSSKKIHVSGISGAWNHAFIDLVRPFDHLQQRRATETIVLASETIYSPASIRAFSDTLLSVLVRGKASGGTAIAFVAAKRMYFGVGGGVDEFLRILEELGGGAKMVWETEDTGVGRVIMQVTKEHD